MILKVLDNDIVIKYSEKIIELITEVLDINGIIVDKDYSSKLVSKMGKYIDDGSAYIVGAFSDNQLVGLIWCYRRIFNQEERLHIYHFIVDKTFRGAGIGRSLLNNVLDYAQKEGICRVDLMATSTNKASLDFYYRNGFIDERVLLSKKIKTID